MTCRELRLYFEDPLRIDTNIDAESEHLAQCGDCARFVEQRRALGAGLRLARVSAPTVPASLDDAVLRDYRRAIANRQTVAKPAVQSLRMVVLGWSVAAAVIVLVAMLLTFSWRRSVVTVVPPEPARAQTPPPTAPRADTNGTQSAARRPSHPRLTHTAPADPIVTPLPLDFRSLMYCDEFSCSGALDVIRVQLPASAVTFSPGSNSTNGTVLADVLVGPDGIARGIRIVE